MKSKLYFLCLIFTLILTSCFWENRSFEKIKVIEENSSIAIFANEDIYGIELLIKGFVKKESVNSDHLKIINYKNENDVTLIAVVKKDSFYKNDKILEILNKSKSDIIEYSYSKDISYKEQIKRDALLTPKLLGDFDENGKVDLRDFINFGINYGIDNTNQEYSEKFDIAPAKDNFSDIWRGIYDICNPNGSIDINDFVIFANNYKKRIVPDSVLVKPVDFIKRSGRDLIIGENNRKFNFHSVGFTNRCWGLDYIYDYEHHSEIDFQRIKDMGFNSIRYYLNYRQLEDNEKPYDYKQEGWDWLDQNVEWAKKYGLYINIDMHMIPPGGAQYLGESNEFWNIEENQNRYIEMWKAIANRYKDEPAVGAYEILNEPVPPDSLQQYIDLAQRAVSEIRSIDKNHLIVVEEVLRVQSGSIPNKKFLVDDDNILYDFHFYEPFEFTHQKFDWAGMANSKDVFYPDENDFTFPPDLEIISTTHDNPHIQKGTTEWNLYEGVLYEINNPEIITAQMNLILSHNTNGKVLFDNIIVKEYNENQEFMRDVIIENINIDTIVTGWDNWYNWNLSGEPRLEEITNDDGLDDLYSLYLDLPNISSGWNNPNLRFPVTQGYFYQISGYMKGINISEETTAQIRLDFERSLSGGNVMTMNKEYLEYLIKEEIEFGIENNVPMHISEFGVGIHCFEPEYKGGTEWIADVLDILLENDVSFSFHDYHSDSFGIYRNYHGLPDPLEIDQPIADVFINRLRK